ncbi:DEAD/DEAH box helicase family protein [Tritrichomonas foetus]|uniref:RNA helicase n=1 Tax=Tritrichomonas foetus TaxID=1144522 RepID=A0A1J4KK49_9EUKA|nr:DEAD/DEAH box helicase family protein [Tritrichomonas foetus]|eukprot:OHT10054.1 DEAD/DEAH box helicase family protein [Tritrichomonas foetus]
MTRSRSFSIEKRNEYDRRGRGDFRGGRGFRDREPMKPSRTEPAESIKLDIELTPSSTPEEQKAFFKANTIKLIGDKAPAPALTFAELNLPTPLQKQIEDNKWETPSPIQAVSIPVALAGRDLIGIAKTGSGKTAAYLLPALFHIQRQPKMERGDGPIVLILAPTRELAQQVGEVASDFCPRIGCRHCCLFGGSGRGPQIGELRRSPALVVATPGRLIDFITQEIVTMERVNFLVLDEADRMLDMGFEPQIRQIIEKIRTDRQTIMFSATWPKEIRKLASDFLVDPVHMVIGSNELTTNSAIKQIVEKVEEFEKLSKVLELLNDKADQKIIIFTKTKRSADQLSDNLYAKGMNAMSIHGDKPQTERDYVLNKFKNVKTGILVATDVAARGLDVSDIDLVVNYDFPGDIESYIHRIGRTARGNKEGMAVTYFTDESKNMSRKLYKVLSQAKQEIPAWLQDLVKVTPRGASRWNNYRGGRGGGGGYGHSGYGRGGYGNSDRFYSGYGQRGGGGGYGNNNNRQRNDE